MPRSRGNHQRLRVVPFAILGIVVVGMLVWFALSTQRDAGGSGPESVTQNGPRPMPSREDRKNRVRAENPDSAAQGARSTDRSISEESEDGPQFPLVDQILADAGLSNEEAAVRLLEIASNKDLSVLEREEALAHGLHLDFPRFVDVVSDTRLPQPMAQRFFDEMLNYNEHRALQVKASILLMDHEDAAMREEAAEQLAFYIGLEEYSDKPEELKQEAYAFLEDLANRPSAHPEPGDPDADIPETEPINPQVSEEEDDQELDEEAVADKP